MCTHDTILVLQIVASKQSHHTLIVCPHKFNSRCRIWIANNPRNSMLRVSIHTHTQSIAVCTERVSKFTRQRCYFKLNSSRRIIFFLLSNQSLVFAFTYILVMLFALVVALILCWPPPASEQITCNNYYIPIYTHLHDILRIMSETTTNEWKLDSFNNSHEPMLYYVFNMRKCRGWHSVTRHGTALSLVVSTTTTTVCVPH